MKIPVSHGHLEAHLRSPDGTPVAAAVVCHPHPLHGGTMHTKAVFRTAQALNEAGIVALRFNFRGVGTSSGTHDEGRGEQDDARAALDWLQAEFPGLPLIMAGFSFGSRVALKVGAEDRVKAVVAMGLPVSIYDLTGVAPPGKPLLVVQGEEDEFGNGEAAAAFLASWDPSAELVRIPMSDHYFHDHFDELRAAIAGFFTEGGGRAVLKDESERIQHEPGETL